MKRIAYILLMLMAVMVVTMTAQDDVTRQRAPQRQDVGSRISEARNRTEGGNPSRRAGGAAPTRTQANDSTKNGQVKAQPKAQPKALTTENETIPDSLLNARWRIQRTTPVLTHDLDSSALDLRMPDNIKLEPVYDDSLNLYYIGSKMGEGYLNAPIMMTPEEYMKWSERRARYQFFRGKDAENVKTKGEDKFSFTDMHFDLGPAEKIFGPGGVRVKTQGTAELKVGATMKNW